MPDRILIVEDERITAEHIRDILKGLGYVVQAVVATGREAIREAETSSLDLVLMDIRIKGDMDGTETARILWERFDLPVVYLTAHADRETLQRAKQARPLGYVVKPFQESELQASVEIALHRHRTDRKSKYRHQHLTDVLRAIILGIVSVDKTEIILSFNPAAEELTGWAQADAIGGPVRRVLRLVDIATGLDVELPLASVLEHKSLVELKDKLLITKTGARQPIAGNIAPVRDARGEAAGVVIVFGSDEAAVDPFVRSKLKLSEGGTELQFGRFRVIAASETMKQILAFALRVARSEASVVLLEGESGTGKDLFAQFLHYSSSRGTGPFVPVHCAAIPEALLESELFGHERGAFSDARHLKRGLFEVANGGTLFLDEVGETPLPMQTKLLRVLETQSFRRLGGVDDIEVDVRIIAATNRVLSSAVQTGDFRLDLFHRLSIIQVALPPLRERVDDVLPLAHQFLRECNQKYKASVTGISPAASEMLKLYDWPGNVRELRNVIERAVLLKEKGLLQAGHIRMVSVPAAGELVERKRPPGAPAAPVTLKESEKTLIVQALEKTGGNKTKAAALLGISRDVLRYRMKRLEVPDRWADVN